MTEQRYSSKAQEQHYQPYRLKLVYRMEGGGFMRSRYKEYYLVIWDTVTHTEVDRLAVSYPGTKAVALDQAKTYAQRHNLPFDLQADVVTEVYDTWKQGPRRDCLICDDWHRSWEPFVCDRCKRQAADWQAHNAERQTYAVRAGDLITLPAGTSFKSPEPDLVLAAISKLTGSEPVSGTADNFPKAIGLVKGHSRSAWQHYLALTEQQAQGIEDLVQVITQIIENAHERGKLEGSSLLTKLRDGTISPEHFQTKRKE